VDIERAFTQYGDPANPAIVMVHGIRLGRAMWEPHARALARRFHVITLDLPGHGALVDVSFTAEHVGAVLDHAIARIATSPPLLVGYSLGGFAGMQYAAARPERTSGLILAGCTLDFDAWKSWPYEAGVGFSSLLPQSWFDYALDLSLHMVLPREWADTIARIPFNRDVLNRTNAYTRDHARFSTSLAGYPAPILFINGEHDLVFRLDERRYRDSVPKAAFHLIRGTDHTAPMRKHREFAAAIEGFANGVFAQEVFA